MWSLVILYLSLLQASLGTVVCPLSKLHPQLATPATMSTHHTAQIASGGWLRLWRNNRCCFKPSGTGFPENRGEGTNWSVCLFVCFSYVTREVFLKKNGCQRLVCWVSNWSSCPHSCLVQALTTLDHCSRDCCRRSWQLSHTCLFAKQAWCLKSPMAFLGRSWGRFCSSHDSPYPLTPLAAGKGFVSGRVLRPDSCHWTSTSQVTVWNKGNVYKSLMLMRWAIPWPLFRCVLCVYMHSVGSVFVGTVTVWSYVWLTESW